MKVFIKKLRGTKFEIEVNPQDTVADVKKIIETVELENVYPASRQMFFYHGKLLKDGTTLTENNVAENDGILITESPKKSSSSSAEASTSAVPGSGSNAPAAAPNPLDFLRNNRHFQPLRAMVTTCPRTLEPILDEVTDHYPELIELIAENEDHFLDLLSETLEGCENPPNQNYLSVDISLPIWTSEESLAIARLEALGFGNLLASELFYACNKDEEEATGFLLKHMKFED